MEYIRKNIRIILLLLLPLYFLVVQSTITTRHTHVLANGLVVTHYHPFFSGETDTPFKDHGHSEKELRILALLHFEFYATPDPVAAIFEPVELHYEYLVSWQEQFNNRSNYSKIIPRGPPVLLT